MSQRPANIFDDINKYDENFINSISLNNVKSLKDLRNLLLKLEHANYVVTRFYEIMYNDYITMINSDYKQIPKNLELCNIKRQKTITEKIQKAYNYILYLSTFENPFKSSLASN